MDRLLAPDMFSGWGIRTLSALHPAYNPYSYQNGSVWPHDNGFIALGFKRYGFAAEAARVARAVSGAASFFALHQVPELYAGLPRELAPYPVQYLGRQRAAGLGGRLGVQLPRRRCSGCGRTRRAACCWWTRRCRPGCRT